MTLLSSLMSVIKKYTALDVFHYHNTFTLPLRLSLLMAALLSAQMSPAASTVLSFRFHEQAEVLYSTQSQLENYIIALNKYRKTNNIWTPKAVSYTHLTLPTTPYV